METETHFYDLTQETLQPIPFKMIWRKDFPTLNSWKAKFTDSYKKASIVLYSRYGKDAKKQSACRAYLKIDNEWWCFVLPDRIQLKNDYQTLITTELFPAKADRLFYLVDAKNQTASTHTKIKIAELKQQTMNLTELNETYTKQKGAKIVFFEKEMIYDEIAYTPFPILIGGTVYYNLHIDKDILQFKDHSYRSVLAWKAENLTGYFTVPKIYEDQLKASFLILEYPTNTNESGAKGMYVIKPNVVK